MPPSPNNSSSNIGARGATPASGCDASAAQPRPRATRSSARLTSAGAPYIAAADQPASSTSGYASPPYSSQPRLTAVDASTAGSGTSTSHATASVAGASTNRSATQPIASPGPADRTRNAAKRKAQPDPLSAGPPTKGRRSRTNQTAPSNQRTNETPTTPYALRTRSGRSSAESSATAAVSAATSELTETGSSASTAAGLRQFSRAAGKAPVPPAPHRNTRNRPGAPDLFATPSPPPPAPVEPTERMEIDLISPDASRSNPPRDPTPVSPTDTAPVEGTAAQHDPALVPLDPVAQTSTDDIGTAETIDGQAEMMMDEDMDDEESSFMGGEDDEDEDEYYEHDDGSLGFNLRAMAGFYSNHHGRFKALLENIRPQCPAGEQLTALEELANLLSISQEETLMGQFNTEGFVREFVRILGGTPPEYIYDSEMGCARPDTASITGTSAQGSVDPLADDPTLYERQILASRCLANLIEAMPYAGRSVVENNGVSALVAKLNNIQVIDLAEQCLETLEKVSIDNPNAIVRENGLMAILSYHEFFNIHVQRTAMNTVSNCCRRLQESNVTLVRDAIPLIAKVVHHSDRRLQEAACKSVVRLIESYRHSPYMLQQLVTAELCTAIKNVLAPPVVASEDGENTLSTTIPASMVTELVHALSLAVTATPIVAEYLMATDFSLALYAILTGSHAPEEYDPDATATNSDGGSPNKMSLLHNLSSRPKEQLQEALDLTIELLPASPRSGVFDARNYSEKALAQAKQDQSGSDPVSEQDTKAAEKLAASKAATAKDKLSPEVYTLGYKLCKLMLPALVEIHTASAVSSVRHKAIVAILKTLAFASATELESLLAPVPMSTFLADVLSSEDGPVSVQGSLQIVELLLLKLGSGYRRLLERAGVVWEIEHLAQQDATSLIPRDLKDIEVVPKLSPSMSMSYGYGREARKLAYSQLSPAHQRGLNVLRAQTIVLLYPKPESEKGQETVLDRAMSLAQRLSSTSLSSEEQAKADLDQVFDMLAKETECLAGWELGKSGLIRALLLFVGASPMSDQEEVQEQKLIPDSERRSFFTKALVAHPECGEQLVHRLQETLSRSKSLEPASLGSAVDDSTRRWPGLGLTKQMRLKLMAADPPRVPGNYQSLVIGIHAVAPFTALEDFLRVRLASYPTQYSPSPGSNYAEGPQDRLSSILADAVGNPPGRNPTGPVNMPTRDPYLDMNVGSGAGQASGPQGESTGEIHLPKSDPDSDSQGPSSGSISVAAQRNDPEGRSHLNSTPGVLSGAEQDHFVFTIGGRDVSLDETVFGAVWRMQKDQIPNWTPDRSMWSLSYPVYYRRVRGPRPTADIGTLKESENVFPGDPVLPQALKLLQVLLDAFSETHTVPLAGDKDDAFTSLFINKKLTAQLNRQLEEPLITASQVMPGWAKQLPRSFPFLFPFSTRFAFLQATSFGSTRIIARWQTLMRASGDSQTVSRAREEAFGYLGRVSRRKVRIGRDELMDSVVRICDAYVARDSLLETEYFDEVGTGSGPTLEFYSMASREFARLDQHLWLGSRLPLEDTTKSKGKDNPKAKAKAKAQPIGTEEDRVDSAKYVDAPQGLFPLPLKTYKARTPGEKKQIILFRTLGTFVAKSLLDSRIIHIEFNPVFLGLVIGTPLPHSLATLGRIDKALASSLGKLYDLSSDEVDSLGLDFTLPGDDAYELIKGGKKKIVTRANLDEYVTSIFDAFIGQGTAPLVDAFRQGFTKMVNWKSLALFTPDELVAVFGNAPEDWSRATLSTHIKPDHGFNADSDAYQNLLNLMASFNQPERRVFLQWLTGSPKLPIGGFKALQPPLTVVRRPHEAPLSPDDYLPSVMTCVNYLKLPEYSTSDILQLRMRKAMHEGGASFHLS